MTYTLLSLTQEKPLREISIPWTVVNSCEHKALRLTSIVDTGTSHTAIALRHAQALGLQPVGTLPINDKDGAAVPYPLYRVDLVFSRQCFIRDQVVVGLPLPAEDMLLGMDVLSQCRFVMGKAQDGKYIAQITVDV